MHTREDHEKDLLQALGITSWEEVDDTDFYLSERMMEAMKTEKGGYKLVSHKPRCTKNPWQARTSGKGCGQRDLGCFPTEKEAVQAAFNWIVGLTPTPPTPSRLKPGRAKRGEAELRPIKKNRCNYGQGELAKTPSIASHNLSHHTPFVSQAVPTCARASTSPRPSGCCCRQLSARVARHSPPTSPRRRLGPQWRRLPRSSSMRRWLRLRSTRRGRCRAQSPS